MTEAQQHRIIVDGLERKTCACHWVFVTHGIDRTKMKGCRKPCPVRDEVLRALNVG